MRVMGRDGVAALIVAAGTSQRMQGVNKLLARLGGKPLLAWSVDTCQECAVLRQIVLALNNTDLAQGAKLKQDRGWCRVTLCPGGTRRQDSVKEGLKYISDCEWVMIHDGARPFLTSDLIERGLEAAKVTGAAIAAVPVKDTVKLVGPGRLIKHTLDRDGLWAAQTPQIFSFDMIIRAYKNLAAEVTDDAAAVERMGYKVQLYMGDYRNIKVTTPEDLALARIIARQWKRAN